VRLGHLVRKLLGPRYFKPLGRAWRSLFVSLAEVVESVPALSPHARVLEVGGGDGQLMNALCARFPQLKATIIDIQAEVGTALDPSVRQRVEVLGGTSVRAYAALERPAPDLVLLCDVLHHVPPAQRAAFLEDLALVVRADTLLFVKDVRPGSPRAYLGYLSDYYITGDRAVSPLAEADVEAMIASQFPWLEPRRTGLHVRDAPNYSIVFSARS
jgi:2-polyprenyl-3-methyl-5-hydroxy-6-metoxy-1,4-benzoquinol methylase